MMSVPIYWRIKMSTRAAARRPIGPFVLLLPALAIAAYVPLSGSFFQQVSADNFVWHSLPWNSQGHSYIFFATTGPPAAGQRTQHWQQLGLTVIIAARSELIVAAGSDVPRF
jgi:hypothetical protein